MKHINWIVRFKNPVFWATIGPAATAFIYTVLKALGIVPALSEDVVLNLISVLITALTAVGVLVDPTTRGVGDSALALTYKEPRKDDTEEEAGIL